jgi:hypothetical protein
LVAQKNVSDQIFDTLEKQLKQDPLFKNIQQNLMVQIRSKRPSRKEIETLLKKVNDENP